MRVSSSIMYLLQFPNLFKHGVPQKSHLIVQRVTHLHLTTTSPAAVREKEILWHVPWEHQDPCEKRMLLSVFKVLIMSPALIHHANHIWRHLKLKVTEVKLSVIITVLMMYPWLGHHWKMTPEMKSNSARGSLCEYDPCKAVALENGGGYWWRKSLKAIELTVKDS